MMFFSLCIRSVLVAWVILDDRDSSFQCTARRQGAYQEIATTFPDTLLGEYLTRHHLLSLEDHRSWRKKGAEVGRSPLGGHWPSEKKKPEQQKLSRRLFSDANGLPSQANPLLLSFYSALLIYCSGRHGGDFGEDASINCDYFTTKRLCLPNLSTFLTHCPPPFQ